MIDLVLDGCAGLAPVTSEFPLGVGAPRALHLLPLQNRTHQHIPIDTHTGNTGQTELCTPRNREYHTQLLNRTSHFRTLHLLLDGQLQQKPREVSFEQHSQRQDRLID
jgi:hypothetical protein